MLVVTGIKQYFAFRTSNTDDLQKYVLSDCTEQKTVISDYMLAFILPLYAFDFTVWYEVVKFLILFCFFGYLYIKNHLFVSNLIFVVLGYKVYECTLLNTDDCLLKRQVLSKKPLPFCINNKLILKLINNTFSLDVTDSIASRTNDD